MSVTGCLPKKWSTRKICFSSTTSCNSLLRARAEVRSRPKGFSIITVASRTRPAWPRETMTGANNPGGVSK